MQQALWREAKAYPIGQHGRSDKRRDLGSRVPLDQAKEVGWNFLSQTAFEAARHRAANPHPHETLNPERLWSDLLSSMPLCFNLFGELWNDSTAATQAWKAWLPDLAGDVEEVCFEWSPGRLDPSYLGNRTAFDVAFLLRCPDASKGIIGVETKYHEFAKKEKPPKENRLPRYREVTEAAGIFNVGWEKALIGTEFQQIWLDHLLVLSMLQHPGQQWSWGRYVLVYPARNPSFAAAAEAYREVLTDDETFAPLTIEQLLDAQVLPRSLEQGFRERYLW